MTNEEQILDWIAQYRKKRDEETCPAMVITLNNMIKNLEDMLDDHEY